MKVYTKTGDKGETSLFSGKRTSKNSLTIKALGDIDTCNAALGVAISLISEPLKNQKLKETTEQLNKIQHSLFSIGAAVATPIDNASEKKKQQTTFDERKTLELENWIDKMEESLPPLTNFILPGGHLVTAQLHLARSFARQAERAIIPLFEANSISNSVLHYLNRLSDYFFVVSRYVTLQTGSKEVLWKKDFS